MCDFYIGVHSDASSKTFPTNRLGSFKTVLSKEYDLGNIKYNVAVSSVTRYYETALEDTIFLREDVRQKRSIAPNLELTTKYSAKSDVATIKSQYDKYLIQTDPIVVYDADGDKHYTVKFTVGALVETFTILSHPVYRSMLAKPLVYRSPKVGGVYFELSDMLGEGVVLVVGSKGIAKTNFSVEFSTTLTKALELSQPIFSGELDKAKTRANITLRAKNKIPKWVDLRTTLPYYWRIPKGLTIPLVGGNFYYELKMFASDAGVLADYLKSPFYGNAKAVTPFQPQAIQYSYKIHTKLATLFKLDEEFDTEEQIIEVFATQNNVETLMHSQLVKGSDITAEGVERLLQDLAATIEEPHKLKVTREGEVFSLKISEGIRVKLPYAFNSFTFESVQEGGEWPTSIHYGDDEGLGKIEKSFKTPYRKTFVAQVAALQKATQEAFDEITKEIEAKSPTEEGLKLKIQRDKNNN